MPRKVYTPRAGRHDPICLHIRGSRICVARKRHDGDHNYIDMAPSARLGWEDVQHRFPKRSFVQKTGSVSRVGLRVEGIFSDGTVLLRSRTVGTFRCVSADDLVANYVKET